MRVKDVAVEHAKRISTANMSLIISRRTESGGTNIRKGLSLAAASVAVALVWAIAAPVSEGFAASATLQVDGKSTPKVEFAAVKKKAKRKRPSQPIARPPGTRPPGIARPPAARPPIARPPVVVVRPPRWRGARWGAVVAGVTLGTIIVVAANAAPPPPSPDLCWTWTNAARTHGYWYYCSGP